jgi:hypothetical protein
MVADNKYDGHNSRPQHWWVGCLQDAGGIMANVVVVLSVPWITGLAVHRIVCPSLCLN